MYTLKKYFFAPRSLFVYFLLILNLDSSYGCSSSEPAEYRVLKKTDSGGKQLIVAVDESAKLYCRTNVPWKKCIWKPPRNGVRQVIVSSTRSHKTITEIFLSDVISVEKTVIMSFLILA